MTEFMNTDGDGTKARGKRNEPRPPENVDQPEGEAARPHSQRRPEPESEATFDDEQFSCFGSILRQTALLGHPLRYTMHHVREELKVFALESNRESAPIGFRHGGPAPVSITGIRCTCREIATGLEAHIQHTGDGSALALKMRLLAQAVQTELQEFDIYLTQSNFRGGLVAEGELSHLLTVVNALQGNLGQRLVEFDAIQASLDG